ncbi:MAG: DUF3160 domain-containing protein, partial [Solobacterium sp.]|nr:DUF3160 domain-containing protein [Solobacterium sp.]
MKKMLAILTAFCLLTACSSGGHSGMAGRKDPDAQQPQTAVEVPENAVQPNEVQPSAPIAVESFSRPALITSSFSSYSASVKPQESFTVDPNFSNVVNYELFQYSNEDFKRELAENYFMIRGAYNDEFFGTYEDNAYTYQSSFITTDSLLHTFHLYY